MDSRRTRWFIIALLFAATAINYIDRQTLSVLNDTLRSELHFSDVGYANVVTAFLVSYTIMYSAGGRLIDYLGARLGLALTLAWWSVATMLTGLARGVYSLGVFRFLLGVAEPCVYPAGIKICAEWFPPEERALPLGIFSSGSALGAVIAPPFVVWLTLRFSWRFAFLLPGLLGLCLVPLWLKANGARAGTALVASPGSHAGGGSAGRIPWWELLRKRMVWGLVLPRFATDAVWYFYLFWLPDYLQRERHFNLHDLAAYGWIPMVFASGGCVTGGALSDWLIRRGIPPVRARMAMLITAACLMPLGALVGQVKSVTTAFSLICVAIFFSQYWPTNTGALTADLLPAASTGTVVGMMGTAGSLGGIVFAQVLGRVVGRFGYSTAFILAGALHPIAALTLTLLLRGQKARPDGQEVSKP
jgi:ACS family hexuronate transporter-like MFS transporter